MSRISQFLSKLPSIISSLLALAAYVFLSQLTGSKEMLDFLHALGGNHPIELIPLSLFLPQSFRKTEGDGGYKYERNCRDTYIPRHASEEEVLTPDVNVRQSAEEQA
jgi:hypothetical protein